jgi:hypothetical protein
MTPLLTGVFASQISGHLDTFAPTGSYDALATYTVPAGGASSVTFTGIPNDTKYSHLQIRGVARYAGNDGGFAMYFNGDTTYNSNYHSHNFAGGGGGSYTQQIPDSFVIWTIANSSRASGIFSGFVTDILDFNSTSKHKTSKNFWGFDANGAGTVGLSSMLWANTAGITTIRFDSRNLGSTSDFAEGTQFSIYGVKG